MTVAATPVSDVDLFSDENLSNPYPAYSQLREIGPVVYLQRHRVWAFCQYEPTRQALLDYRTFSSVNGIALTEDVNKSFANNVLVLDPPEHTEYRRRMMGHLGPRPVEKLRSRFADYADYVVTSMIERSAVDAVKVVSEEYVQPLTIELIGLTDENRHHVVAWAQSFFNTLGPANERTMLGFSGAEPLFAYLASLPMAGVFTPGSWAADVRVAVQGGGVDPEVGYASLGAYIAPSMITTIDGMGSLLWLLATHPEQWRRLRETPELAVNAFDEALRCETPIQLFGRRVTCDTQVDDAAIPAGAQAAMLYGSANRDERKWGPTAADFDVERRGAGDQLAFGHGPHTCLGLKFAKLQADVFVRALAKHVDRIELDGEPHWELNNLLRGPASLPVRLVPA